MEESENIPREKVKEELADILSYAFLVAEKEGFDIEDIVLEKIKKNEKNILLLKRKAMQKNIMN